MGTSPQNTILNQLGLSRMTNILLFVRHTMETSWSLGFLSLILVVIPIIGMDLVHKYGWEHWEPFAGRQHVQGTTPSEKE